MTYIVPRVLVEQEFTQTAESTTSPLAALIIGPQYRLFRYNEASEKVALGLYENDGTQTYNWPAAGTPDLDYTKIILETVNAKYFPLTEFGATNSDSEVTLEGSNRIKFAFPISGTNVSSKLPSRGIRVGDYITLTDGDSVTINTRVVRLVPEMTTPEIENVVAASGNQTKVTITASFVSSGFTGTRDIVYKLRCIQGGPAWDGPGSVPTNPNDYAKIRVTSNGGDSSPDFYPKLNSGVPGGPTTTTTSHPTYYFEIGTQGVRVVFTPQVNYNGFRAGDEWYIIVTGTYATDITMVDVADSLDALEGAEQIFATLYLRKNSVVIPQVRSVGVNNWEATADGVIIYSGITVTDPSVAIGNSKVAMPVAGNVSTIYLECRLFVDTNANAIGAIKGKSEINEIVNRLGPISPDNPLAEGVYNAVLNAGDVTVYYLGVKTNDFAGYQAALDLSKQSDLIYSIVPLTFDEEIQDAVIKHVEEMSTPIKAKWRICWLSSEVKESELVYRDEDNDGYGWTAYTPDVSDLTKVRINNATLITDNIRAGDNLIFDYGTYVIKDVLTETDVVLTSALSTPIVRTSTYSGDSVQIQKNYAKNEQIDKLIARVEKINSRRVRVVFPDVCESRGVVKSGYFLAAALAGLRSFVVPNQGLTNVEILGFDKLPKALWHFTYDQLNQLAAAGVWIVTQDKLGAPVYTRHQLTTNTINVTYQEDSITTNVDSISYALLDALKPYIGIYNINPSNLLRLQSAVDSVLLRYRTVASSVQAGPQLLDYRIDKLEQDPVFKDKVNIQITLTVPYPMNNITIVLIV